ncbi:hypothetical protein BVX98_05220 [bacterium F11]|nr:hypothetical protein BVX98_05220 [bacterium F11]
MKKMRLSHTITPSTHTNIDFFKAGPMFLSFEWTTSKIDGLSYSGHVTDKIKKGNELSIFNE